jgi:peptidoglycan/LPS O-acetylase OafA/YrhL
MEALDPRARNPTLDGIRALAVLWVFAFHAQALLGGGIGSASRGSGAALAETGLLGVQLFFVLSGFLLALPWMRSAQAAAPGPSAGRFYRRRMRRILPAYYVHVALLFALILPLLHGGYALLQGGLGALNLAAHAGLMHFLHPGSAGSLGLNMALWSLSIEAQFYLLLPLLAPLFTGSRVFIALPAAVFVSLAWKTWTPGILGPWLWHTVPASLLVYFDPLTGLPMAYAPHTIEFFVERQFPGELMAFALGMAAANLAARMEARDRSGAGLPLAGLGLVAGGAVLVQLLGWATALAWIPFEAVLVGETWRLLGLPAFLVSVSLVVLLAHRSAVAVEPGPQAGKLSGHRPFIRRILGNAPLATMGLISYSFFLWHEPVLRILRAFLVHMSWTLSPTVAVSIALVAALTVAAASFRFVERPWLQGPSNPSGTADTGPRDAR